MEGRERGDSKERVRVALIDPLVSRGLQRKPGRSVEDHQKMLDSLKERLAYMAADKLAALAKMVEHSAEGPKKNIWPAEVSITNWARGLQAPLTSKPQLVLPRPAIASQKKWHLDPHDVAAKRMNAGEAVGEGYVWGRNGDLLVKRGLVSGAVRGDYQRGSIRHHVNLYKHDTDRILRRKIGEASYARYAGFIASLLGQGQFDTG